MECRPDEARLVRYAVAELDRHLYYNPAVAAVVVTDSRGARIIDDYLEGKTEDHPFLADLREMSLFSCADQDEAYGRVPDRLIVEVTTACNLRCKTCYMSAALSREDELTTDEIIGLLEAASGGGSDTVAFIGGEPLMRTDLADLVEVAADRFSDVQVSTNGTISDRAFLSRFSDRPNVTIQVSIDGPDPQSNDAIRGRGNFAKSVSFLEMARESGLRTSLSCVLNKYNYNRMGAVCDLAREKGCSRATVHKVHVFGRAESFPRIVPSKAELMHGMGVLLNKFREYEGPGRMVVDFPHNRCFRGDPCLDAAFLGCHFGRAFAYVTSQGDLVCCSHLRDGEFVYGNVREAGLLEIWRSSEGLARMRNLTVDDIPSCSKCEFKYMCRGSCRADALGHTGSITGEAHDCDALRSYYAYVLEHFTRNCTVLSPEQVPKQEEG